MGENDKKVPIAHFLNQLSDRELAMGKHRVPSCNWIELRLKKFKHPKVETLDKDT